MADAEDAKRIVTDPANAIGNDTHTDERQLNGKRAVAALRDLGAGKAEARELISEAVRELGGRVDSEVPVGGRARARQAARPSTSGSSRRSRPQAGLLGRAVAVRLSPPTAPPASAAPQSRPRRPSARGSARRRPASPGSPARMSTARPRQARRCRRQAPATGSPNCSSRSDIRCAWASIDASGSKRSLRPYAAAVAGMNCAIPAAPAGETANGLKFDSAISCAASSAAETFQRCAAAAIASRKRAGTNAGRLTARRTRHRPAAPRGSAEPPASPAAEHGVGPSDEAVVPGLP